MVEGIPKRRGRPPKAQQMMPQPAPKCNDIGLACLSVSAWSRMTGQDRRRLEKILIDYPPDEATLTERRWRLKTLVLACMAQGSEVLDLTKEKALESRARRLESEARKIRLDRANEKEAGLLIDINEMRQAIEDMVMRCRGHLLALPQRTAASVAAAAGDYGKIVEILTKEIHVALTELSQQK